MNGRTTERIKEIYHPSPLVKRAWRLDNGATDVELFDTSEAGWEAFCAWEVAYSMKPLEIEKV